MSSLLDLATRSPNISKITTIDDFFTGTQPTNSLIKAISNNMYGINSEGTAVVPVARDTYGKVFFVRPQLNLTMSNLEQVREFSSLATDKTNSVHAYIRRMLDPRLAAGGAGTGIWKENPSALVDVQQAFIPVLSNNLTELSGWPDPIVPTYTSKKGLRGEEWGIVDGNIDTYGSFDMEVTFRNTREEPILHMMDVWTRYMTLSFEGVVNKYLDYIINREIDYNTRIYVILLDETYTYVKHIAATGVSWPINVPYGSKFDYSSGKKYNDRNKEITIRFKSLGAIYDGNILTYTFNQTVGIFHSGMRALNMGKTHSMEKVPKPLLAAFSYRSYPRINSNTLELEWWVDKNSNSYKRIVSILSGGK